MNKKNIKDFVRLTFKAVSLAIGVAVVTLSIMNEIDTNIAVMLLGIGVASSGIALITENNKEK